MPHICTQDTEPAAPSSSLLQLDDACLLEIFKFLRPLPEVMYIMQTCWRFRTLLLDKRQWLIVSSSTPVERPLAGHVYPSLQAAVSASRPGNTLWLAPGVHAIADVALPWPLHLLGGGSRPEDTVLVCPRGADTGLDFRASGKTTNLCLRSTMAPCITHRAGQLSIERCILECDPGGLPHLCAPLLTLATCIPTAGPVQTTAAAAPTAPPAVASAAAAKLQATSTAAVVAPPPPLKGTASAADGCSTVAISASRTLRDAIGMGKLTVTESCLQGGGTAVHCLGTGALTDVRVIFHARCSLYWFSVDCRYPGLQQLAAPHAGAPQWLAARAAGAGEPAGPDGDAVGGQHAAGGLQAGVAKISRALARYSPAAMQALAQGGQPQQQPQREAATNKRPTSERPDATDRSAYKAPYKFF